MKRGVTADLMSAVQIILGIKMHKVRFFFYMIIIAIVTIMMFARPMTMTGFNANFI